MDHNECWVSWRENFVNGTMIIWDTPAHVIAHISCRQLPLANWLLTLKHLGIKELWLIIVFLQWWCVVLHLRSHFLSLSSESVPCISYIYAATLPAATVTAGLSTFNSISKSRNGKRKEKKNTIITVVFSWLIGP